MQVKQSLERQLVFLSLIASLPLYLLLLMVMSYAEVSVYLILLTALLGGIAIAYCHINIHLKAAYQFRSLSILLDAMTKGDYSLRAAPNKDDALNELITSINGLAVKLKQQHIETVESQLLLHTVIDHIDVAIIAINEGNELILANPAATKLLDLVNNEFNISQLGAVELLARGQSQIMALPFVNSQRKFNVHMEEFREGGKQQKLLFIADVSTILRQEEQNAWQNLVRVISHEINNSLSPISSISQTLQRVLRKSPSSVDAMDNLTEGLSIIAQRANNLKDFVNSYQQIAKLPVPRKSPSSIMEAIHKVLPLYSEHDIDICASDDFLLLIDPIQFEQVLINLIKNAIESVRSTNRSVVVKLHWYVKSERFFLSIADNGIGISNPDNLFVPFYSTKSKGSGIGLVLSRQIIEVHKGQLTLKNRQNNFGCEALIELPLN